MEDESAWICCHRLWRTWYWWHHFHWRGGAALVWCSRLTACLSISAVLKWINVPEIPGQPHKVLTFLWRSPNKWRDNFPGKDSWKTGVRSLVSFQKLQDLASEYQEWSILVCKSREWSNDMDMGHRVWVREVSCWPADVNIRHQAKLQTKLRDSSLWNIEWSQEDYQQRLQKNSSSHEKKLHKQKIVFLGKTSRMDDLWVFRCQRHRRICLGPQWYSEGWLKNGKTRSFTRCGMKP